MSEACLKQCTPSSSSPPVLLVMKHFQLPALPYQALLPAVCVGLCRQSGTQQILPTLSALTPAHGHSDPGCATISLSSKAQTKPGATLIHMWPVKVVALGIRHNRVPKISARQVMSKTSIIHMLLGTLSHRMVWVQRDF